MVDKIFLAVVHNKKCVYVVNQHHLCLSRLEKVSLEVYTLIMHDVLRYFPVSSFVFVAVFVCRGGDRLLCQRTYSKIFIGLMPHAL